MTLGEIAKLLDAQLNGPADLQISRPVQADSDDESGIAFAESVGFPGKRWSGGGPGRCESGFRGDPIALDATPLRPVDGKERKCEQQD